MPGDVPFDEALRANLLGNLPAYLPVVSGKKRTTGHRVPEYAVNQQKLNMLYASRYRGSITQTSKAE